MADGVRIGFWQQLFNKVKKLIAFRHFFESISYEG